MNYIIEVSDNVDEKSWNDKLLQNPAATAYQTFNWIKVYEKTIGSKPIFILAKDSKGEIVAQLACVIHKNSLRNDNVIARTIASKLNLSSVLNWFYGPVIHSTENKDEISTLLLSALDKVGIENNVSMIRGTTCPLGEKIPQSMFLKNGYSSTPWSTYVTNLQQTESQFYDNLDKKTRYDIRKSEKNELEFQIGSDASTINEFIKMKQYSNAKKRKNTDQLHQDFLYKKGYEKVFLVKHKGESIGGILNIMFNGNIVQHGVVNSSKTELLGGTYLTWNAMKWAIQMKFSTYDMGGVNPLPDSEKEKGIAFFKSKWGGEKHEFSYYAKVLKKSKVLISSALKDPKRVTKKISRVM